MDAKLVTPTFKTSLLAASLLSEPQPANEGLKPISYNAKTC